MRSLPRSRPKRSVDSSSTHDAGRSRSTNGSASGGQLLPTCDHPHAIATRSTCAATSSPTSARFHSRASTEHRSVVGLQGYRTTQKTRSPRRRCTRSRRCSTRRSERRMKIDSSRATRRSGCLYRRSNGRKCAASRSTTFIVSPTPSTPGTAHLCSSAPTGAYVSERCWASECRASACPRSASG